MIGSTAWAVVAAVACLGTGVTCLALAAPAWASARPSSRTG